MNHFQISEKIAIDFFRWSTNSEDPNYWFDSDGNPTFQILGGCYPHERDWNPSLDSFCALYLMQEMIRRGFRFVLDISAVDGYIVQWGNHAFIQANTFEQAISQFCLATLSEEIRAIH